MISRTTSSSASWRKKKKKANKHCQAAKIATVADLAHLFPWQRSPHHQIFQQVGGKTASGRQAKDTENFIAEITHFVFHRQKRKKKKN